MSRAWEETRYTCVNDCRQEGCPDHHVKLEHFNTIDSVNVYIDGKLCYSFDEGLWNVLLKLEEQLQKKW